MKKIDILGTWYLALQFVYDTFKMKHLESIYYLNGSTLMEITLFKAYVLFAI